ncbi:MAG: Beta-1 4-xylanase [Ignavibacteria bacterium]|nr:MAG: Beta-1 4-xylanase [Ignavibacteria bacterium]KAF0160856.1 MAG: Beta-1 4-xylanase [Ignavibacteria bacterium]
MKNYFIKCFLVASLILSSARLLNGQAIETNVPALKDVFKNDFYIGCLLSYPHIGFATDPVVPGQSAVVSSTGGNLIKYHMNSMSPGNNMKPQYTVDLSGSAAAYNTAATQALKDSINVNPIIRFNGNLIAQLNWAKRQGFTFRGHTLVWHSQTPGTAFFRTGYSSTGARLTKEKMTERMGNYIKEVIRILHESWPGLLSAFDVVNEAVNDSGNDRTTDSEWYITFGDNSYLMKAFELTRKYTLQYGEPQIKLYYNDYNTHVPSKADGIVRICKPIFDAGFLDGIGMQDHDQMNSPSAAQWIASYNKFFSVCNEMAVTELDVSTGSGTNNPPASVLASQANQYAQLFKCFVERSYFSKRGKVISVSKDGLNDQYTFVTNQSSSLWDTRNQCKPAFYAVVDVGIYYNKLDSLLNFTNTLKENDYTTASWTSYTTALSSSKAVKGFNYNTGVSAADALKKAFTDLDASIKSLVLKTADVQTEFGIPVKYKLEQNYPNPFNPSTVISYHLPESGLVTLRVFDVLGSVVAELVNEFKGAGKYNYEFVTSNYQLVSGVYFYSLECGNFKDTKKFVLLR